MDKNLARFSKFLSLVLRHRPDKIGVDLDKAGWAPVADLLAAAKRQGVNLTVEVLRQIVEQNDKKRFQLSEDGTKIRANQGHSIGVELGLTPAKPPNLLFHGTAKHFVESIRKDGIARRRRDHVHLSADIVTAIKVGSRHGTPVVLTVQAGRMQADGLQFFRSENGVWLTESVPSQYVVIPEQGHGS